MFVCLLIMIRCHNFVRFLMSISAKCHSSLSSCHRCGSSLSYLDICGNFIESEYATAVAKTTGLHVFTSIFCSMGVGTPSRVSFNFASFIADSLCTIPNMQRLSRRNPYTTTCHKYQYSRRYKCVTSTKDERECERARKVYTVMYICM